MTWQLALDSGCVDLDGLPRSVGRVWESLAVSRLNDLLRQLRSENETLSQDIEREVQALADRRAFGLNFERHVPEAVELPGRRVRKGDKVRVLPPRGEAPKAANEKLWIVTSIDRSSGAAVAELEALDGRGTANNAVDDLVVVAEFRDPIYPGLVSTGKVERGGDRPFHAVINAENYHALQTLLFTHRGKVDCIYIDPPYNTGAKDWKYNNDYVEGDDLYRHSKWLAFMERRLLLAKELLDPDSSVLIVTIDEKEFLRLGLLLEQTFAGARIQMVTSVISSQASVRDGAFSRCDEYLYFVMIGDAAVARSSDDMLNEGLSETKSQLWFQFVRTGAGNLRADRKGMFFPFFVDPRSGRILGVGSAINLDVDRNSVRPPEGAVAVWPMTASGQEGRWRTGPDMARSRVEKGLLRATKSNRSNQGWSLMTVNAGTAERIEQGEVVVEGYGQDGSAQLREISGNALRVPKTVWNKTSHNAGWHGSKLLANLLPGRNFPYPKSLYAVEDALRLFVQSKPQALVLDFFGGSGTTAHAVMRLNKQDGGCRRSIVVTNNEVSAADQVMLRKRGLRPGDPDWESQGICERITVPRLIAGITGRAPDGSAVAGKYSFTDEFPLAEGFDENIEFFTLTYEAPLRVASNREFRKIASLLWIRAGSEGRRIEDISAGWDVADAYGVLANLDHTEDFLNAVDVNDGVIVAYVLTDEDRLFESVSQALPDHVEPVRLYEAYLRNFEIESGRGSL
jgi:adenine-specific DNA-methyltransferase